MDRQKQAYLYALATVLLWSTVASAFKLSLRHIDPIGLLFYASCVSCLFLFVVLCGQQKLGRIKMLRRRDWLRAAGLGALNPLAYYLILFEAYDRLPAQEAQPLNYTWAVTLALLSIPLLKQKIGLRALAALLISYAGVWVIATRGAVASLQFADPLGVGLALGSTVIWALYWIANTKNSGDPVLSLWLNFLFGSLWVCPLVAFGPGWSVSSAGLLGAAYVGVFEMGLSFVLWLKALKLSKTTAQVGNLIFLAPFLSLILIHFLVGEEILASTFLGLALILTGNLVQQIRAQA